MLPAALLKLNAGVLFIREGWQEIMRVKKKKSASDQKRSAVSSTSSNVTHLSSSIHFT